MVNLATGAGVELEVNTWSFVAVHTTCPVECGSVGAVTVLKDGVAMEVDTVRLRPFPPSTATERDATLPLVQLYPLVRWLARSARAALTLSAGRHRGGVR